MAQFKNPGIKNNSITTAKIANDNITTIKLADAERKNIFDYTKVTEGYFIGFANPDLTANSGYSVSDYTAVEASTDYVFNFPTGLTYNANLAFFDSDYNYISGMQISGSAESFSFATPANCVYLRFSYSKSMIAQGVIQLEVGTVSTAYTPFGFSISKLQINNYRKDVRQYVYYYKIINPITSEALNEKIVIAHKYNDDYDMFINFVRRGPNSLMQISDIQLAANTGNIVSADFNRDTTDLISTTSDWVGPYYIKAINDVDGDLSGHAFTGGCHGYDDSYTGTATARTVSYEVYADDIPLAVNDGVVGCKKVSIKVVNYLQAYNTEKEDGSGREVLQETVLYTVSQGKIDVMVEIKALEEVDIELYYGLQTPSNEFNTIHYVHGDSTSRETLSGVASDSGVLSSYPNADRHCLRSEDGVHNLISFVDNTFGLGARSNVLATYTSAFKLASTNKIYFNLVRGTTLNLAANAKTYWRGYYLFTPGLTADNADLAYIIDEDDTTKLIVDMLSAATANIVIPQARGNRAISIESGDAALSLPLSRSLPNSINVAAIDYGSVKITL